MGLWPLFIERSVSTTGTIRTSSERAMEILRDHGEMISLNPLVVAYEAHKDVPSTYVITDHLEMLGRTSVTKYSAKFEPADHGVVVHVNAPGGMRSRNTWKIREHPDDPESIEVTEEAHVEVRSAPRSSSELLTKPRIRARPSAC